MKSDEQQLTGRIWNFSIFYVCISVGIVKEICLAAWTLEISFRTKDSETITVGITSTPLFGRLNSLA